MGVGLSLVTGLVVFTVGVTMFPVEPPPRPAPPAHAPIGPAAPVTPPSPAPTPAAAPPDGGPAAPADAGSADASAAAGDGGALATDATKAAASKDAPDRPARKKAPAATNESTDASAGEPKGGPEAAAPDGGAAAGDDSDGGAPTAPAADCTLPDKDIAREAWRHNWPTVCSIPDSNKGFIIIPVKGSIESAVSELKRKPVREARVTLPSAESQLSLKVYKLRRLGFKDLKIGPPDEGSGVRFRVRLMNGAGDPVFDVKDGYAKITVASPE